MTAQTELNLDTSVLFNYLYSTILPEEVDENAEIEGNKGCRKYFDTESVLLVVGGKAEGEFNAACDRREDLYQDITDFIEETGSSIVEYPLHQRDVSTSSNDEGHFEDVRIAIIDQPAEGQLSTLRRCHQQLEACQRIILESELDRTFNQFEHDGLLTAIDDELDIDDDAEILVDATIIARDHGISRLASLDSDLVDDDNREQFEEIIDRELPATVPIEIVYPPKDTLK